jgi:HlyD family secretion protein
MVTVGAPIEGTLEELLVQPGEPVYEGQLLGRIKNTGLDAAQRAAKEDRDRAQDRVSRLQTEMISLRLEASRAHSDALRASSEYDRAERAYLRQQMLYKEGATPRLVYEKSTAALEEAKRERDTQESLEKAAEERLAMLVRSLDAARKAFEDSDGALEEAQANAAAAELRSPVNGLLIARTRDAGAEVTPDVTDLFQIAIDLAALEAVVEPPPPELARIRPGQEAYVQIAEFPDAFPGRVKAVQGNQVVVEFISRNPALKPGVTAQVRIKLT